jgi:RNA polymerase sigma-70 factor (ECF subfamily)
LRFETTRWSLVLAAGGGETPSARAALAVLCEAYWYPLYAYIRRRGHGADEARDLTQGFLTSLVERRDFDHLDRRRGTFRAFLLASLQHYLANETARQRAAKRGGGAAMLSLTFDDAEGRYRFEPAEPATPETLFDRRWALTVIDRVLQRLRRDWQTAGRAAEFDALKDSLLGQAPPGGYAALASRIGSTEGAVKVAAHRLRRDFRGELRRQIAETVLDPAEVDDEIRYLIRVVSA